MKILITGATGLIGREIGKVLVAKGHQLLVVSRDAEKAREILPFPCEVVLGDLKKGPLDDERLASVDAVINLMGESVAGSRWTKEKKENIYKSRVIGTRHLIASLSNSVKAIISGSAVGYYGSRSDETLTESSTAGSDYLAKVCDDWEAEVQKGPGRKVCIRTGIVLSPYGGALEQMLFPFRAGVGGALGDGQHWMSWIHIDDIVGLFVFALENESVQGALNGVAPEPMTNREFSQNLASAVGSKLGVSVPTFALKALFGEGSEVVLSSQRVSCEKAQSLGYRFSYVNLKKCLDETLAPWRAGEDIFYAEQFIPLSPEKVFPFFKEAHNLEKITPPLLSFHIESVSTPELQQGTKIDYRLKIHGVPAHWRTEIDEWSPPYKFVDNQLQGPYNLWHHTHEFRPFCGGTLMVDRVRYRLPLGKAGWLAAGKWVRKDVENIFAFRRRFIAREGVSLFVT